MKKLLSLILIASLMLSLTSCNMFGEVEQVNDSLTIYVDKNRGIDRYIKNAITEYKGAYPDITLNIVELDTEEDYTKMRTEIMGRGGPDVILVDGYTFPDVKKTIESGVFADLTPFSDADSTYNEEDYYSEIMEVGSYKGLQCVFPISFSIPTMITTQEGLDKYDLSFSDKPDLLEVTEQAVKFINQNNDMLLFPNQPNMFGKSDFNYFNVISDIVDYEDYTIDLSGDEFLKVTRNYKEFYKVADLKNEIPDSGYSHSSSDFSKFINNVYLFFNTNLSFNDLNMDFRILSELKGIDQTPVTIPIYGFGEKINAKMKYGLAINNYSENKQNAYDFLKLAVDLPFYRDDYGGNGYGIKKSELQNILNLNNEMVDKTYIDGVKLEQDIVEQHQAFIDDIGSCSMQSGVTDMLYEYFVPYFEDESTLEECIETAKARMEIYMSE